MLQGSFEKALPTRRRTAADVMRTDIIAEDAAGGINCKLIEQDPASVLQAHFHHVDQFQVFVGGGGQIGKRPVDPITVHFTKAHTPYGPLSADHEGLSYVVVRAERDSGAEWMPEAAARRDRTAARGHAVSKPLAPSTARARFGATEVERIHLIAPDDTGLAATLLSLPPGAVAQTPDPRLGRGLVLVVTAGTLLADGTLGVNSCIYLRANEKPVAIKAGTEGADVVCVSFPKIGAAS